MPHPVTIEISDNSIEAFLAKCSKSSNDTYESFKELLHKLEDKKKCKKARIFLGKLAEIVLKKHDPEQFSNNYHFYFENMIIDNDNKLLLLQLPSIFTPEEWSFTFYEGLARYPLTEFQARTVCELGCGNGWISISLARRCYPDKLYGLDINPKAIVAAKINLYLNALDSSGNYYVDSSGKNLLDRVEFHVSDLLTYCCEQNILIDRVIGCIPQVLNLEINQSLDLVSEQSSDDILYSLSNYYVKQGYIEDQFGLGLIARALEESVQVMKASGKVIFNMGGRPGSRVLESLFTRRGYHVRQVWQRIITQAQDTDIFPLVEIEQKTPYRFEFYMEKNNDKPISAKTAWLYQKAGGKIAHSITVYEAVLADYAELKKIIGLLGQPEYIESRNALDLSFTDSAIADEKISFLAHLADYFSQIKYFPYENTQGIKEFRARIADYLWVYFRIPYSMNNVVIAPNRSFILKNLFNLYNPELVLIDHSLFINLPEEWAEYLPGQEKLPVIIETPQRIDLVCKLIETLKPQFIITGLADFEAKTSDSFLRLVNVSEQYKSRVIVDISSFFDLSSKPVTNGIFQYLAENRLPLHVSLICGLIKNRVYEDLELSILLSENKTITDALINSAELTYSRTPLLTQHYYDRIIYELIKFQIRTTKEDSINESRTPEDEVKFPDFSFITIKKSCETAFQHPAIKINRLPIDNNTIRLDYGENTLSSPESVKPIIFESFARQNISLAESLPDNQVLKLLTSRFGLGNDNCRIIYGDGVAPLFSGIIQFCAESGITMVFPSGSYGYFVAVAKFYSTEIKFIETKIEDYFKITPKALSKALKETKKACIFLNAPVVNPTGAVYSALEVYDLLAVANTFNSYVIIDSVFSGLEHTGYASKWNLEQALKSLPGQKGQFGGLEFALLGGISKEFSAGGIRFGFGYTCSQTLASAMKKGALSQPHPTIMYSVKNIFSQLNEHEPNLLSDLTEQRRILARRAKELSEVLSQYGWIPLNPQGGLFMIAKPEFYIGKKLSVTTPNGQKDYILDSNNIHEALFYKTGLLINNSEWTGITDYCRFVLSVEESEFKKALECLKDFHSLF